MLAIGIIGTNTDVGKTVVSGILAATLKKYTEKNIGVYKPAASGCIRNSNDELISTDAEFLMKCAEYDFSKVDEVVPYRLEPALAPAEAAKVVGVKLDPIKMVTNANKMISNHDITIVEGVGGIAAPLTDEFLVKDFYKAFKIPVIIVVDPVLGSVNHAILTASYAKTEGLEVLGFIVNNWDEANSGVLEKSNLYHYEKQTGLKILGKVPKLQAEDFENLNKLAETGKEHINISGILEMISK